MRIITVSDSLDAPTGFGTNTRSVASILAEAGHTVGYGGCQNDMQHKEDAKVEWPLGSGKHVSMELLPILFPKQEHFAEKSFPIWIENFKPDLVFTHLDIQMFRYMLDLRYPKNIQMGLYNDAGKKLNRAEMRKLIDQAFTQVSASKWKLASIIPIDGEPTVPSWGHILKKLDYVIAMSRYGQTILKKDYDIDATYIPHGVDTNIFKPRIINKPDNDTFVIGCVARNQHRKHIPRLMRAFKIFVEENNIPPEKAKLLLHMDWEDRMGWNISYMASKYVFDIEKYILPPTMHPSTMSNFNRDNFPSEDTLVNIYNLMDIFALPTGGEGFGIPYIEALSCGKPVIATNYTTTHEIIGSEDKPTCSTDSLLPYGDDGNIKNEELKWSNRGCLVPYKDLMWDTPNRAACRRALWDERLAAQAFKYYYDNRDVMLEHGVNARAYAKKNYGWPQVSKRWQKWIENVTEREGKTNEQQEE